jgi:hypothetical protein
MEGAGEIDDGAEIERLVQTLLVAVAQALVVLVARAAV